MTTSAHLPLLVVDKSFAQVSTSPELGALTESYMFVVPDDFYHEVFTTSAEKRFYALNGFPEFRRVHLETYLVRERETEQPALTAPREELTINRFNPDIVGTDWKLAPEYESVIEQYKSEVVNPSIQFWKNVIGHPVPGFTEGEYLRAKSSPEAFRVACAQLRDTERIRAFAREIEDPLAGRLDPRWFIFRKYQAMMMQGLVFNFRYPNAEPPNLGRIENDVHDLKYLTLALVTGNLATRDCSTKWGKASMGWRFETLLPGGNLITSAKIHLGSC